MNTIVHKDISFEMTPKSSTLAKRLFYRTASVVLGNIGGRSSEDATLQLIRIWMVLYGLEACPLRSSDNNSLDFVIGRF